MSGRIGDQPIEPEHAELMKKIAKTIDQIYNGEKAMTPEAEIGFVLMVFPFGPPGGRTNYISNASLEDVIRLMEDQLARLRERKETRQ